MLEFNNEAAPFEWIVWDRPAGGSPNERLPAVFRGEVKWREDKGEFCYITNDVTLTETEMFEIWAFLRKQVTERTRAPKPAELQIVDEEELRG